MPVLFIAFGSSPQPFSQETVCLYKWQTRQASGKCCRKSKRPRTLRSRPLLLKRFGFLPLIVRFDWSDHDRRFDELWFLHGRVRHQHRCRNAAETIDARQPIIIEGRVHDAAVTRRMIEALSVHHDANMPQVAEENQRTESEFFV